VSNSSPIAIYRISCMKSTSMPQRFCPLGFFSFYVNKNSAEAGGGHHCIEHACALWDNSYGQCGIMSAIESLGTIAESTPGGVVSKPAAAAKVSQGVSSIFSKLRDKKRLPTAEKKATTPATTPATTTATNTATTPATPATTPAITTPIIAVTNDKNVTISAPEVTETKIVNPATIKEPVTTSSLPIKSDSIVEFPTSTPTPAPPPPPPPVVVEVTPEVAPVVEAAPVTPIVEAAPEAAPVTPIVEAAPVEAPVPPVTPVVETKNTNISSIIDVAAEQLSQITEFSDDFSDLLTPPSIPVSDLPVVSKPDDGNLDKVGDDG
jgi:hypothetical protein